MKNGILIALFVAFAVAIGYLIIKDKGRDYDTWQKKIDRHSFVVDSLSKVISEIDKRVYAKDSLLVAYIQTLNKSLYELDKEARKDKATLDENEQKQSEMLKAFCERMNTLQKPDFCR